ncbi:MAG: hypothetical protein F4W95_07045 [Chloroflexi bacterium]|nr:hypothetical protein [Chloroflexota bacterium]MYD48226.1 hypothetical protein [Chloroflexota bacterium]
MTGTSIARFFRRLPALALLPVLPLVAAAAIACTAAEVAPPESAPAATPAMSGQTAAPASSQAEIADFVSRQEAVSAQWDEIRHDFDQWSAGLDACRPGAMRQALNGFAVSFNDVTEQARGLSRSETASELADLLIVAAEEEEAAFRRLRDHWQPSNVSLFEEVEVQRSAAARARQATEDRAIELQKSFEDGLAATDAADDEFAESFASVAEDWAQLHEDYAGLREDTDALDGDSASQFAEAMAAIVDALDALPDPSEDAEDAIEALRTAAQEELAAFQAAAEAASSETGLASDGEAPAATPDPAAKFDIDIVDAAVNEAKEALESAIDTIGEADEAEDDGEIDPEQGLAELQDFRTEYNRLVRAWDAFHDGYNEWRGDEGGCDRVAVMQTLDEYSLSVSQLAREVRALPSTGSLLPVYTLLTDAAAREENAIRSLRNTWQPFTLDAFRAVHQERINSDGLRRQADIAVQELQNRF